VGFTPLLTFMTAISAFMAELERRAIKSTVRSK